MTEFDIDSITASKKEDILEKNYSSYSYRIIQELFKTAREDGKMAAFCGCISSSTNARISDLLVILIQVIKKIFKFFFNAITG